MKVSEAFQRLSQPTFWVSGVQNAALSAIDSVSPTLYGKRYRTVRPFTMLSNARLRSLYHGVKQIAANGIGGDIVECGTARGGSAALMGLAMQDDSMPRRLWLFDTFEGMPKPTLDDPDYELAIQYEGTCKGSFEEVTDLLASLQLGDRAILIKGLFQDTVAQSQVERIALLHLDGDWYESVLVCLDAFYDRVVPGGIIQIDDFGYWAGARKAVREFFERRNLRLDLKYVDYTGRVFVKPEL